jgi:acetoin utilization deacetylase AcuC-like enzyme
MKAFYSDQYHIDLPPNHRFPIEKYRMLREGLLEQRILTQQDLIEAPLAGRDLITLAHTPEYVDAIFSGSVDARMMRQIGLPWSRCPGAAIAGQHRRCGLCRRRSFAKRHFR